MGARQVAEVVLDGRPALFSGKWGQLNAVKEALRARAKADSGTADAGSDAAAHRASRTARREASRRLFVAADVRSGRLAMEGGPAHVGFLEALHGRVVAEEDAEEQVVFRVNDIMAMHVSWQFYLNGVQYPFLEHRLHPFFGVYASPSPVEHLLLLDEWLAEHPEALSARGARALDLGTGSGVISFLLRRRRPRLKVVASDLNPNAVFSVERELERWGVSGIEPVESDLFTAPAAQGPFDAIVFNPPWVPQRPERAGEAPQPGDVLTGNDYPPELFARLFAGAAAALKPGGRLLIVFADYALKRGLVDAPPLQEAYEASSGGLRLEAVTRRPVPAAARAAHSQTRREKAWALAQDYSVELWQFLRT